MIKYLYSCGQPQLHYFAYIIYYVIDYLKKYNISITNVNVFGTQNHHILLGMYDSEEIL